MALENQDQNKKSTKLESQKDNKKSNGPPSQTTDLKPVDNAAQAEEDDEDAMNRFQKCCCCFRYQKAAMLIGFSDVIGLVGFIGFVIFLKMLSDDRGLSSDFTALLIVIPILAIILVSFPRSIAFLMMCQAKNNLKRRKSQYMTRAVTTILLFALSLAILVLLILSYKGTEVFTTTQNDKDFLASNEMKWTIILLAIMVVISTLFDLYFSLAVRTFYLNLANGNELSPEEEMEFERQEKIKKQRERLVRQKEELEKKKQLALDAQRRALQYKLGNAVKEAQNEQKQAQSQKTSISNPSKNSQNTLNTANEDTPIQKQKKINHNNMSTNVDRDDSFTNLNQVNGQRNNNKSKEHPEKEQYLQKPKKLKKITANNNNIGNKAKPVNNVKNHKPATNNFVNHRKDTMPDNNNQLQFHQQQQQMDYDDYDDDQGLEHIPYDSTHPQGFFQPGAHVSYNNFKEDQEMTAYNNFGVNKGKKGKKKKKNKNPLVQDLF